MSSIRKWVSFCVAAAGGLGLASQAGSQAPPLEAPQDTVFFLSNTAPLPPLGGPINIVGGGGDALGPLVKDKPYSARSITESTQTLADGNRIVRRNEARIYRDSAGRTRREQTLGGVGAWQAAGEPRTMISINDPVADKSYALDPVAQTAREIRPFRVAIARAGEPTAGAAVQIVGTNALAAPPLRAATLGAYEPAEDLGEQVLEGLLVQGTRLTDTIPAGAIGNERPIEIVTERWYSKDIEAMVLQRYIDPRFGETTYKLVNVVREEPAPELFQLPQGYALEIDRAPRVGLAPPAAGGAVPFQLRLRTGDDAR